MSDTQKNGTTKNNRSGDRKGSIVSDTYDLILKYGISGCTTARIAAKGGITEAALYRHFKSRHDILVAVFEQLSLRFIEILIVEDEDNVVAYIRKISKILYDYVITHPEEAKVMFEFICSSPAENLRGDFQGRLKFTLDFLEGLLRNGVDQGSVRPTVDLRLAAWEMFSLGLALSLASIVDLNEDLTEDRALASVDNFLARISAQE